MSMYLVGRLVIPESGEWIDIGKDWDVLNAVLTAPHMDPSHAGGLDDLPVVDGHDGTYGPAMLLGTTAARAWLQTIEHAGARHDPDVDIAWDDLRQLLADSVQQGVDVLLRLE